MTGALTLTPDELAELVGAVMEYNGFAGPVGLALYRGQELVGYDRAVITFQAPGLKVRSRPEPAAVQEVLALRQIVAPDAGAREVASRDQG